MGGMSHDEVLSDQKFQELLEQLPEMLREQGMSEEDIAEGVAGVRDWLPQLRRMLADFCDTYRSDFVESMQRLLTRQSSHFPDFDQLYRRKADLDWRAANTPLPEE